jgi:hypothetical protein
MPTANHTFTLILKGVDRVDEEMEDRIYGAIDDALLSSSNGEVSLDFDREAASLLEATIDAVRDVHAAGYLVSSIDPPPRVDWPCVDATAVDTADVARTTPRAANIRLVWVAETPGAVRADSANCVDTTELLAAHG